MNTFYRHFLKRALDVSSALVLIVALSPLLLLVAAAVFIVMGTPVLFRQSRPGLNEKIFTLYKFRSMRLDPAALDTPGSDAARLTAFGKFLRSTSLDELPQLFNILKGEMSFIGPRPLLPEYLPLYNQVQRRRHEVRPGLTGLAQVSGRNDLSWSERFDLDVRYIDNLSILLDLEILIRTLFKILSRRGVTSATSATMEPFTGNRV